MEITKRDSNIERGPARAWWLFLAMVLGIGCGGSGTGTHLRTLAEGYPSLTAPEIKERLDRLSLHDHFVLEYVGKQFKGTLFLRACEVDPSLQWSYLSDGTVRNCTIAQAEWQQYLQWLPVGSDPWANSELGRNDVIVYFKCQSGEIDSGSCALYQGTESQIATQMNGTSQQIVDNIGGRCRIGIDPGCYP